MIDHLQIKNVALIENVEISFDKGLNILSGETGAGKSMIIGSINFLFGGRPNKDFIRNGEENAFVEGVFYTEDNFVLEAIKNMGIEIDKDNLIIISRNLQNTGKSVCRVNGKTITVGMLKEISNLLLEFHGQHENQSLLNSSKHITLLDKFCNTEIETIRQSLLDSIKKYKEIIKNINEISGNEKDRQTKIDLLSFQKNEIENAKLKKDEEENLLERRKILLNSQKIATDCFDALGLLYNSGSDEMSASEKIVKALGLLIDLGNLDKSQSYLAEGLESISMHIMEIIGDLKAYSQHFEHDPNELEQIERRLDTIHILKRKYGNSISEILNHYNNVCSQLDLILNSEEKLNSLKQQKKKLSIDILKHCEEISSVRKKYAKQIETQIVSNLQDLGMNNVKFEISIERKKEFSNNGYDKVEFLISTNLGEPLKPLAKIASGGEMSRIMLALKTVLADADNIETFVFDEIDAGISGRTAQQVGEKLALISKKYQILCITHLPQIAAMGDSHFLIEKKSTESKTTTNVFKLDNKKTIDELARLIGGAKITQSTIMAAWEMKEMAVGLKKV